MTRTVIRQFYADGQPGSAAAAYRAAWHFTPELLARLKDMGVGLAEVTLHVGLDTFAPVTEDNADEHASTPNGAK